MVVIGVDPGSLFTGYGVIRQEDADFHVLACGVIRLNSRRTHAERIGEIYRKLDAVISAHNPSRAAIETVFVSRNVQSALKLGQVRGSVIALAVNRQLELVEYAPREVKAAVTGRGSASKQQVAFMVQRILQIRQAPETNDVTDALGIALCDLLKTGNGACAAGAACAPGAGSRKKNWAQFVASRPDMIVR
ncbi:MAG: crossover junction endodeoxyribonuclease RuvC [Chlorobium sp.]|uniref:crossover junction endodeoxyribonuclease RuvC n=1 Tax=Chlorobium sp. TaxID=1095 RepID=UPI0025C08BAE|nr:crossover junction endodeoxyribonuclease RuvC [Chlorobium sp.]MCF8383998.1 crossover junction endodeoxyribonuclease RuvC [Chlorobium sp.]